MDPRFQYTESEAKRLGVNGWIRNTERRTVEGELEGSRAQIDLM